MQNITGAKPSLHADILYPLPSSSVMTNQKKLFHISVYRIYISQKTNQQQFMHK